VVSIAALALEHPSTDRHHAVLFFSQQAKEADSESFITLSVASFCL
jgi:hypothetical protein